MMDGGGDVVPCTQAITSQPEGGWIKHATIISLHVFCRRRRRRIVPQPQVHYAHSPPTPP